MASWFWLFMCGLGCILNYAEVYPAAGGFSLRSWRVTVGPALLFPRSYRGPVSIRGSPSRASVFTDEPLTMIPTGCSHAWTAGPEQYLGIDAGGGEGRQGHPPSISAWLPTATPWRLQKHLAWSPGCIPCSWLGASPHRHIKFLKKVGASQPTLPRPGCGVPLQVACVGAGQAAQEGCSLQGKTTVGGHQGGQRAAGVT